MSTPLRVSELNGVKVYNCTAGKTTPQWLEDLNNGQASSLRYNAEFRGRIELIQEFTFPQAASCIRLSRDGNYIGAAGVYKPQIKVFDTGQLTQKFERHLDAEVVDFQFLSDDYSKIALLRHDRHIELHASYGRHFKTRIPKFGRQLAYHYPSCDLYVACDSNFVYRLNLNQGIHRSPLDTDLPSVNTIDISGVHQLVGLGGTNGRVECWDPRDKSKVGNIDVLASLVKHDKRLAAKLARSQEALEVTSIKFDTGTGLLCAVGLSTGQVCMYDLRRLAPVLVKDHRYGLPIKKIQFHESTHNVFSMDSKTIKIWDRDTGTAVTSIENESSFNDFCVVPKSGLLMAAGEQHRLMTYYIPSLGPAPRWLAYLDSLTEEMEETNTTEQTSYDDYKFVTREQLTSWGVAGMIGTELLKPKMHGFYMDARLFDRIKPQDDVQQYETVVENKVQQQLAKLRDDRITVKRRLPKVNKQYAEQLMMANLSSQRNKKAKNQEGDDVSDSKMPLIDDRFAAMFANKDFEVDATSREFRRLNPSLIAQQRMKAKQAEAEASEDEQNAMFEAVSDSEDIDSDDDMVYSKKARQKVEKMQAQLKAEEGHHTVRTSRQPAMFAMKDGLNVGHVLGQTASKKKKQSTKKLSLQDRLAQKAAKKAAK